MPLIPNTKNVNWLLRSVGDGQNSSVWSEHGNPQNFSIDWAWSGTTLVPSGADGYIPPKRVPVHDNQVITVLGVQYFGNTGGDIFELYYNGAALEVAMTPVTWTTVTATWTVDTTTTCFPFTLSDGDYLAPVFTTAAGDGWAVGIIYTTA